MVERVIVSNDSPDVAVDENKVSSCSQLEQHLAGVALVKKMSETYHSHSSLQTKPCSLLHLFHLGRATNET